jgi:alginate O-acetyltransferase complex protein AlgI
VLFSSIEFLCGFLPLTLLLYYLLPGRKLRNRFLLLMSLGFYAWGEPLYVLLMLACIAGNYCFGLLVDKFRGKSGANVVLVLMLFFDLGLLGIFKYSGFVVESLNSALGLSLTVPSLALPIGISFFTFQGMSYVIDVYRGQAEVRRNLLDVGLYVAFFPQLIAGPIVRYNTIAAEIDGRRENWQDFTSGIDLFIIGLGKKVILANNFAIVADKLFDGGGYTSMSVGAAWVGAIAYTLQIYFDFGGYSDMAIGLGRMFGFHFLKNFNYPYIAHSVTDFWRRWHISLSSWFRDYVYIPLGGNRVPKGRLVLNLFAVWLLTGLWHGANWTFVAWGLYYFCFLVVEKLLGLDKKLAKLPVISNVLVLVIVTIGWVLFRAADISSALDYIGAMFGAFGNPLVDEAFIYQFSENKVHFLVAILACVPLFPRLAQLGEKLPYAVRAVVRDCFLLLVLLVALAALAKGSYNPFIYFNF